jgi:hypothetical protein
MVGDTWGYSAWTQDPVLGYLSRTLLWQEIFSLQRIQSFFCYHFMHAHIFLFPYLNPHTHTYTILTQVPPTNTVFLSFLWKWNCSKVASLFQFSPWCSGSFSTSLSILCCWCHSTSKTPIVIPHLWTGFSNGYQFPLSWIISLITGQSCCPGFPPIS